MSPKNVHLTHNQSHLTNAEITNKQWRDKKHQDGVTAETNMKVQVYWSKTRVKFNSLGNVNECVANIGTYTSVM